MKKLILVACLGVSLSFSATAAEPNTLSEQEVADGWQLLFNGEDLSGWKTFNGGEVSGWKVVDGILHNSGVGSDFGGDISTVRQYTDFELSLEWQITPLSNSGIFIRAREGVADAIYKSGPEYQLSEDAGIQEKRTRNKNQFTGASYAMYEAIGGKLNPLGEWNEARIVVRGTHVEHWLNGTKVVEYELWSDDWMQRKANSKWKDEPHYGKAKSGVIGLQDHGGLTMFRNIKIREL